MKFYKRFDRTVVIRKFYESRLAFHVPLKTVELKKELKSSSTWASVRKGQRLATPVIIKQLQLFMVQSYRWWHHLGAIKVHKMCCVCDVSGSLWVRVGRGGTHNSMLLY